MGDFGRPLDAAEVCCGGPPPPKSSPDERPGYRVCGYVDRFIDSAAGPVPVVLTERSGADLLGTALVRLGWNRSSYLVAPGLYGIGSPDAGSVVLVTANYKLSFDTLRFALAGLSAWLLVLDTCGINVWCAAGKGTLSTDELVHRVRASGLERVVDHRRLIVPQLGATGIAARRVREQCGFSVHFGPIRAADLRAWLDNGGRITETMRQVSFTLAERAVLIPVEITLTFKTIWWLLPLLFVLSAIGPLAGFGERLLDRGVAVILALLAGIGSGTVLVPLLLPWIPGRSLALKGALVGLVVALLFVQAAGPFATVMEPAALVAGMVAVSSYLGMNFTGSTPYTSPSGVEWEMRRALPLQFFLSAAALLLWLGAPLAPLWG